jgi:hypothetical protein
VTRAGGATEIVPAQKPQATRKQRPKRGPVICTMCGDPTTESPTVYSTARGTRGKPCAQSVYRDAESAWIVKKSYGFVPLMRHHAVMATFDQQGQCVYGPQYNAETITNNRTPQQTVVRDLTQRALDEIQRMDLDEETRQQATAEVSGAGADLQAGRPEHASERLGRLRAMGGALAEVAGAFTRGVSGLGG